VISEKNILSDSDGIITFRIKDNEEQEVIQRLSGAEFLWRGDFQGRCHSLAATQAAWIKGSARIGSGSSGGLLIHTFTG